ncbi:hypothetical protein DPMN_194734, partial [Dreissena polymorpha]
MGRQNNRKPKTQCRRVGWQAGTTQKGGKKGRNANRTEGMQIRQTDEYTGISGTQKSKLFLQVDMKAACYSRQAARFCSHAIIDKRRHVRQLRQAGIYRQKHAAKEGIKADKQASISARTAGWIGEIGKQVL